MIESGLSSRFRFVSTIAMLSVVMIHAKLIFSRWSGLFDWETEGGKISWHIQFIISENIARLAVPIYFFISGYFIARSLDGSFSKYKVAINKRIRSLFVPYMIFCVLWALPYLFCKYDLNLVDAIIHPIPYQFWFLQHLMALTLISVIFVWIFRKKNLLGYIIVILSILSYLIFAERWGDWKESLCFYLLGVFLCNVTVIKVRSWIIYTLIFLYLTILLMICYIKPTDAIMHHFEILLGCSIIILWIFSSSRSMPIIISSGCTFLIFALHEPFLGMFKTILIKLGCDFYDGLIIYLLAPMLVAFAIIGTYYIINSLLPKFTLVLTGGR